MCTTFVIQNNNISVIGENYENKYAIKEFLSDLSSLTLKVENALNIADVTGLYKCRKLMEAIGEITSEIDICIDESDGQTPQKFTINYNPATIDEYRRYVESLQ
jgi:hypothetical protein